MFCCACAGSCNHVGPHSFCAAHGGPGHATNLYWPVHATSGTTVAPLDLGPYRRRDRAVVWLANLILRMASPRYRMMTKGTILYGLEAAARDARSGS